LTQLLANLAGLSRGSLQSYFLSKETALSGGSIPRHPAARAFFEGR